MAIPVTKMTKAQLMTELEATTKENSRLYQYLSAHQNEKPDAVERATEKDGTRYLFRLYRSTGALGGIVHIVDKVRGQKDGVNVLTLDDASRHLKDQGPTSEYDLAIRRLLEARQAAIAMEKAYSGCIACAREECAALGFRGIDKVQTGHTCAKKEG